MYEARQTDGVLPSLSAPDAGLLKPLDSRHRLAGTLKQGDRAFPRLEASLTDQSKKNRAGIRRGFDYRLVTYFFFFGKSSEELPEPLDDSPREEDDPLSESSLSKRPSSSLSRSLLEDPPRLLSLPRPEECRLSLSRSPRFSRLSSGT